MNNSHSNLPALAGSADDGFASIATGASLIIGQYLKFRKGQYPVGRDEGDLSGATLCAYAVKQAWQKWVDSRVARQIVRTPGNLFPQDAEEIADDDGGGEWQLASLLYLRDLNTGADYTFTTSSNGGRRAVAILAGQIGNMRFIQPGAFPIVRLDSGTFRSRQFGEISCPQFTVTGWVDADGRPLTRSSPPDTAPALSPPPLQAELDDEIPF
jgi:hypothetical protein